MLKVPSTISKVTTMSDGGMRLVVDTQELTSTDKAELMSLHNLLGWFVFSPSAIQVEDIPKEPVEFEGQKSLSERLYNTLFVLHEKRGGKPEEFPEFRRKYMERLLNRLKDQINEL